MRGRLRPAAAWPVPHRCPAEGQATDPGRHASGCVLRRRAGRDGGPTDASQRRGWGRRIPPELAPPRVTERNEHSTRELESAAPEVTVVIPTYNRWRLLSQR